MRALDVDIDLYEHYSRSYATYDLVNHLFSVGLDFYWRYVAAWFLARNLRTGDRGALIGDLCAGTGDMTLALRRVLAHIGVDARVLALDYNYYMLSVYRGKLGDSFRRETGAIVCSAYELPLADEVLDGIVLAFALRNLHTSRENFITALKEVHRVLRPGGVFVAVETSRPLGNGLLRKLIDSYIKLVPPLVGQLVANNRQLYDYLARSSLGFYTGKQLADLLKHAAGFRQVHWTPLTFGTVAVHTAIK